MIDMSNDRENPLFLVIGANHHSGDFFGILYFDYCSSPIFSSINDINYNYYFN
ncbi:MAG: hypothetical protein ACTSRH_17125 [Promethearchaeota archaeon]